MFTAVKSNLNDIRCVRFIVHRTCSTCAAKIRHCARIADAFGAACTVYRKLSINKQVQPLRAEISIIPVAAQNRTSDDIVIGNEEFAAVQIDFTQLGNIQPGFGGGDHVCCFGEHKRSGKIIFQHFYAEFSVSKNGSVVADGNYSVKLHMCTPFITNHSD